MQSDFHYQAVYCLARLAGLSSESSLKIATASQFVDESVDDQTRVTHDRKQLIPADRLKPEVTAHHMATIKNTDLNDQRLIWVPYHFLPGARGSAYTEKLVCEKDSDISQIMLSHYLSRLDSPFGLELIGVAAHVYADTFAHYGFSGVSSRRNRVDNSSIDVETSSDDEQFNLEPYFDNFFEKFGQQGGWFSNIKRSIVGAAAEVASGALGHGAVCTCPDSPYMVWQFEYEYADKIGSRAIRDGNRNNPNNFIEACEKLNAYFRDVLKCRKDCGDASLARPIKEWGEVVEGILSVRAEKEIRAQAWADALSNGSLTGTGEEIPPYPGDSLRQEQANFPEMSKPVNPQSLNLYRFFQAASYHRHYILRELLPDHGLLVI